MRKSATDATIICRRYMGWFDANLAHLWEHPPAAEAKRYVKALGGMSSAVSKARGFIGAAPENAVWRNFCLTGALELREGMKAALAVDQLIDARSVR
ncbi:alkyl sulfatase dimerization domain-containing protein [Streptomyces sp. NPDC001530]|uniref:alkyl sulfatase dimerization domain-containing protein n=1 Tax=Streptomyces sp. NPDC001530 TaxID=3364582 RepID=UPI00368CC3CB